MLDAPIHIVFVSGADGVDGDDASADADRRRRQQPGARSSRATSAPQGETYFTNAVSEVFVGENAGVDHYKVQQESLEAFHVASLHVHTVAQLARSRRTRSRSAASSSATTPSRILDGEGGDCTLNGLYLADRERLVDNHTTIDHAKPHCGSHEVYKGILGGTARARCSTARSSSGRTRRRPTPSRPTARCC